jgi:hypothetical protein
MIEGHKFVDAYFTNNARTIVESVWWSETENVYRTHVVNVAEGNIQWEKFLKHPIDESGRCVTIDDLMERTYIRNQELERTRDQMLLKVMDVKDDFLQETYDNMSKDTMESLVKTFFTLDSRPTSTEEQNKERLFLFKLALFEWEEIANAKDKELKKDIRKSKSAIEALYHVVNFLYHRT